MTLPSRWPAILQAVMKGQPRAYADSHYPQWHPAPVTGLMNDPNGFIWFAGRYHLFYQWNPLDCDHRYKCWGHWSSADLVHWQHEPMALMPDEEYDRNGCYSGSAVDNNGVLTLCYTGNVKFDDGSRTAWQCLATQQADGTFKKLGPVLALPEGYTGHVRDPKVWQHDGVWYMVLGAQDLQKRGKVLLFTSADLHHWASCGEIAGHGVNGLTEAGYMWECPDLFALDGTHVLICCPQGLAREPHRYLWQTPVRELHALREEECCWQGNASDPPALDATRLEFELTSSSVTVDFAGALRLIVEDSGLRLERASLKTGETLTRYWRGDVHHLRVLCDSSSVEIFINHGEGVMSSRYFPDHPARVRFEGGSDITLRYWSLRGCMVE